MWHCSQLRETRTDMRMRVKSQLRETGTRCATVIIPQPPPGATAASSSISSIHFRAPRDVTLTVPTHRLSSKLLVTVQRGLSSQACSCARCNGVTLSSATGPTGRASADPGSAPRKRREAGDARGQLRCSVTAVDRVCSCGCPVSGFILQIVNVQC